MVGRAPVNNLGSECAIPWPLSSLLLGISVRPEFAGQIDPIFLSIMDYVERMERHERLVERQVQAHIENKLDAAENALGNTDQWRLSKYALCALIDDLFIAAPWGGRAWWTDNCLERKYFGDRKAHEDFFGNANRAGELSCKDALEVYYLSVVLGFRGFYASSDASYRSSCIKRFNLPESIEAWCARAARSLQLKQGRPPIPDEIQVGSGARPLAGRSWLITSAVLSVVLLGCAIATATLLIDFSQLFGDPSQ
ncbi:MAG: DotU family type IV/VI secretion system protein [Pirellulaceae bacterium]|nr:DotU family type IV/VI secretion system protein [Pirellulaceae bacterium]